MKTVLVWAALVGMVAAARLCHLDLVWIEEAYPLAAAAEVLRGKVLYRDIWFDKPPFYALIYTVWGAEAGLPLRIGGILWVLACCASVDFAARRLWGKAQGTLAAVLLAFFLTFGIPSAVMALAPDLLAIPFHVLSFSFAVTGRPAYAGLFAGLGLLFNSKASFVLLACILVNPGGLLRTVAGFSGPVLGTYVPLALSGAWHEYIHQVWIWGFRYSSDTYLDQPLVEGIRRTLAWAGFHSALVLGAGVGLFRERSWKLTAWIIVSLVAVLAGLRFFPRYYFHLLPIVVLAAARGFYILPRPARALFVLLLTIPGARFGPRYVQLGRETWRGDRHLWTDLALMTDSDRVGKLLNKQGEGPANLLVWGYRPDIYVFSGLPAGTRFLDSQPLTGVLADRHLVSSEPTFPDLAIRNRVELVRERPTFLVDGLGKLNPRLAVDQYPALTDWLTLYELAGETSLSRIYRLRRPDEARPRGQR